MIRHVNSGSKLHTSWLLAWSSVAFLTGVAAAYWVAPLIQVQGSGWAVLVAVPLIAAGFSARVRIAGIVLIIIGGLGLGLWRGSVEQSALTQYTPLNKHTVTVQGRTSGDPSVTTDGEQRLMLANISINGMALHGTVWASIRNGPIVERGDTVTLQGKLGPGFGNVTASMFEANVIRVMRPQPGDIGLHIRDWFASAVRRAIPEPQASLATGFLVGQHSTLPDDLAAQLKIAGLTHAVVASGYNLTILVGIARRLLSRASKYLAFLAASSMVGGFVMVSGLSPSMSRAALVAAIGLAAWYYGRTMHPFVLLALTAAITACINPSYLWGDIGWYLSFASFAGVIILSPVIRHTIGRKVHRQSVVAQLITDTVSAQLATLPIIIFSFGQYSPYALLANVLVLPLVPLVMLLTFGTGVAALCLPLATVHALALPANLLLQYMTHAVDWIANLPGAAGEITINGWILGGSYALLLTSTWYLWQRSHYDFRQAETERQT